MSTGEIFEGIVGGEILRRFTVFLDYTNRQVVFERNAPFAAPFEHDMSGLTVTLGAKDGRKIVASVREGSPAAEALTMTTRRLI